jgi:hypothetical protein
MTREKIIQIVFDSEANIFGLSEDGRVFRLEFRGKKGADGKIMVDADNRIIWESGWVLVTESPVRN